MFRTSVPVLTMPSPLRCNAFATHPHEKGVTNLPISAPKAEPPPRPRPAIVGPVEAGVEAPRARLRMNTMFPCAAGPGSFVELDELTRVERQVAKGAALYRNGDALEAVYAVRSGSFKATVLSAGGDEKVVGLHLPGEIMGLDAISASRHTCEAVALEDSQVCAIPFARLSQLAQRMPQLQEQLLRTLSGDITRNQGLLLLMGGMNAEQRIAALLLNLSRRHANLGLPATRFSLHMTRYDIGSYVGLTTETVSRVFSKMRREGLIAVRPKEVDLIDLGKLHDMAGPW